MHCEAVRELVSRCIWRPELNKLRDTLSGPDQASFEKELENKID